jgi:hypothetical protein
MKKIILLFVVSAFAITSYSQSVSYKTVFDNPKDIPNLRLIVDPFYADFYQAEPHLGWGFRGDLHFLKLFMINTCFRKAYFDGTAGKSTVVTGQLDMASSKSLNKSNWLELGGGLVFADWTRARNVKVVLHSSSSSSGGYTYTHTKYIMVPGHLRHIANIRAGIIRNSTAMNLDEDFQGAGVNITNNKDSLKFGFKPSLNATAAYALPVRTMLNQYLFYAGISYKTITNIGIEADGYGKRHNRALWDIYFDFVTGPRMHFVDVVHSNGKTYELNNYNLKRTGWRGGMEWHPQSKVAFSFKFEFGSMPTFASLEKGITGPKFYMLMTMGVGFQQKLNLFKKKEIL